MEVQLLFPIKIPTTLQVSDIIETVFQNFILSQHHKKPLYLFQLVWMISA